jgi:hypothetical protein
MSAAGYDFAADYNFAPTTASEEGVYGAARPGAKHQRWGSVCCSHVRSRVQRHAVALFCGPTRCCTRVCAHVQVLR